MKNPTTYIEKLDKSMTRKEKLFFLNKIKWSEIDCVIDFGGANGRLLWEIDKYLTKHRLDKGNHIRLVNVEINDQLGTAYKYQRQYSRCTKLFDAQIKDGEKPLIIFSSVLHECGFGVSEAKQIRNELRCYKINGGVIVVRDMFWDESYGDFDLDKQTRRLAPQDKRRFDEVYDHYARYEYKFDQQKEKIWYEYLLKWNYLENWETEVKEEYFSGDAHSFITRLMTLKGSTTKYCKKYILPYKKREVRKNFGFRMKKPTHIKLIIEFKGVK